MSVNVCILSALHFLVNPHTKLAAHGRHFSNRSLGGKETAPSRQTQTEGRGKTLDFNDVVVGFYRMYDLRDYIEAYVYVA